MPEVSVLTPIYNCEDYIKVFLEGLLNQTYKDFEIILINDGSTDKSKNLIESYKDKRIKLFNLKENVGVAKALNFGISKCKGKYIARADADDIYTLDRLEKQKDVLDKNPEISVVGSKVSYFPDDEESELGERFKNKKQYFEKQLNIVLTPEDIKERMYMFWCVTHSVMMIRSEVLKRFMYDENYPISEDYKLLYDLNKLGYKMINISEKLGEIRVSKSSASIEKKENLFKVLFNIKKEEVKILFDSPVYIWGASGYGIGIKSEAEKRGYKISGFIDKDEKKVGTQLEGLNIYSPKILKKNKVKVISASDPGRFEIVDYLESIGYEHLKDFVVF